MAWVKKFTFSHVSCGADGGQMYLEAVCQGLALLLDSYYGDTVTKLEKDMLGGWEM